MHSVSMNKISLEMKENFLIIHRGSYLRDDLSNQILMIKDLECFKMELDKFMEKVICQFRLIFEL